MNVTGELRPGLLSASMHATKTEIDQYQEQVRSAFPLLLLISDERLRQQTEDAHIYALARSSWHSLVDIPWAFLDGEPVSNYVTHVNIVTEIAAQTADILIASGHSLEKNIVVSAAISHDVGKILEYGMIDGQAVSNDFVRHSFSGVHVSITVGLPDAVTHAIALHAWEGEIELPPSSERTGDKRLINLRTKEAIVVACADLLALKILRREFAEKESSAPEFHRGVPINPILPTSE